MSNDIPKRVRDAVKARSGLICERCLNELATDMAHRLPRNTRIHTPENLGHLGRTCHSWAHAHPRAARREGWILPANSRITAEYVGAIPVRSRDEWLILASHIENGRLISTKVTIREALALELLAEFGVTGTVTV